MVADVTRLGASRLPHMMEVGQFVSTADEEPRRDDIENDRP
jgi:hypothetical protein